MRINSPRAVYYGRTVVACTTNHKTCNSYLKDSNVVTHVLGSLSSRFSFWPGYRKWTIWTACVIGNSRCVLTFSTAVMSLVRTWETWSLGLDFIQIKWLSYYQKMKIYKALSNQNQDSNDYQSTQSISPLSLISCCVNKWISKEDQITEPQDAISSVHVNKYTDRDFFLSLQVLWIPQVQ